MGARIFEVFIFDLQIFIFLLLRPFDAFIYFFYLYDRFILSNHESYRSDLINLDPSHT